VDSFFKHSPPLSFPFPLSSPLLSFPFFRVSFFFIRNLILLYLFLFPYHLLYLSFSLSFVNTSFIFSLSFFAIFNRTAARFFIFIFMFTFSSFLGHPFSSDRRYINHSNFQFEDANSQRQGHPLTYSYFNVSCWLGWSQVSVCFTFSIFNYGSFNIVTKFCNHRLGESD